MANRRGRPGRAYEPKPLDATDLRILTELQRDGRVSLAELGRRVALPAPAVGERVQRLEEAGVITGDDCFSFIAHLRAVDELEPILDHFTPFARTTTSILQSAAVPRRPLPLD